MNLLLESEDQPVIWRGHLIGRAITQLWGDVIWGDLDYMLVDLPPWHIRRISDNHAIAASQRNCDGHHPTKPGIDGRAQGGSHGASGQHPYCGCCGEYGLFCLSRSRQATLYIRYSHAREVALAAAVPLLAQLPIEPQAASMCDAGKIK